MDDDVDGAEEGLQKGNSSFHKVRRRNSDKDGRIEGVKYYRGG